MPPITDFNPGITELIDPQNGQIDPSMVVKVTNLTDTEIRWQYANRWITIPPQGHPTLAPVTAIPYYGMVLYCGDPMAMDDINNPRERDRTREFTRLCTLYGVYGDSSIVDGKPVHENFPKVAVSTLSDTPISTVLDDPFGDSMDRERVQMDAQDQLRNMIVQQQKMMAHMQAQLDQMAKDRGQTAPDPGNKQALSAEDLADIQVSDSSDLAPEPTDTDAGDIDDDDTNAELEAAFATAKFDGPDDDDSDVEDDIASNSPPLSFGGK